MPSSLPSPSTLITAGEALATAAFALSGLLAGSRKRLDAVGLCVVAFLAAFGGGTLRDVLLDRRPFFWVEHANWLWGLLGACLLCMALLRRRHLVLTERAIQWPDALGLGLFTAAGTQLALQAGMPGLVAVLMGVISAVAGGVLRDIVCNEIPTAFHDHRPYALCAFAGAWVLVAAEAGGWNGDLALLLTAASVSGLRAVALATGWKLPPWRV